MFQNMLVLAMAITKTPPGLGTVPPPNGWPGHRHYALGEIIHRAKKSPLDMDMNHEILVGS